MSAHTPGPWLATPDFAAFEITGIGPSGNPSVIATVYSFMPDIRLIAAAPDLLAACQSICGVYEGQDDVPIYVRKARAALAKATQP